MDVVNQPKVVISKGVCLLEANVGGVSGCRVGRITLTVAVMILLLQWYSMLLSIDWIGYCTGVATEHLSRQ